MTTSAWAIIVVYGVRTGLHFAALGSMHDSYDSAESGVEAWNAVWIELLEDQDQGSNKLNKQI